MPKISAKTSARLSEGLKRFQPIVASAKARDLNEADSSRIVTDLLADLFGFDRYSEITSEHAIRGTYCDLAVKINDTLKLLIEVKAVGSDLKDAHIKQATDYAANQGVDWVVLTNAASWKIFKIKFTKPIDKQEIISFDIAELNHKNQEDIETLNLISKEGLISAALTEYDEHRSAVNKFTLAAVIQSENVLKAVRKEICRIYPDLKIQLEDVESVIVHEVLKRELVESDEAKEVSKKVLRSIARMEKNKSSKSSDTKDGMLETAPAEASADSISSDSATN